MKTLNQALEELIGNAGKSRTGLSSEVVPLAAALRRVLAHDVTSALDVPPHDNSQMDGYAGRMVEMNNALAPMEVSQRIAAGHPGDRLVEGSVARIFTGAPIPQGADAVIAQEDAIAEEGGAVRFRRPAEPGQNIRLRGSDIRAGEVILKKGRRLGPAELGLCASVGLGSVAVYQTLKVAVFSSGDELRPPGEPLGPGQIYDSNRPMVLSLLRSMGLEATDAGCLPDDLEITKQKLKEAAKGHDVILTCAGVSVGEEDHIRAALDAVGSIALWKISIKPGKPFAFGQIGTTAFLGMPGNPVAAWVTFQLLIRPYLLARGGTDDIEPFALHARAGFDWQKPDPRQEFLRGWLDDNGAVRIHDRQNSAVLSSVTQSEGLVEIAGGGVISRGDTVRFIPFQSFT